MCGSAGPKKIILAIDLYVTTGPSTAARSMDRDPAEVVQLSRLLKELNAYPKIQGEPRTPMGLTWS